MKRWKKLVLLIFSFNILFFTVDSKKREAEAFALSTLALTVGGLATVAVGGYVINKAITSDLGQRVLDNLSSAGQNHQDFIVENMVTGVTKIKMNKFVKTAIEKSVQDEVKDVPTTDQSVYTLDLLESTRLTSSLVSDTGFKDLQVGEFVELTFDYVVSGWVAHVKMSSAVSSSDYVTIGGTDKIVREGSVKHIFQITKAANFLNLVVRNPYSAGSKAMEVKLSNIKVERISYAESPAMQRYRQFANVPRTFAGISEQVNTNLNDSTYEIDTQKEIIGAQSLDDIKVQVEEITENTSQTNTFIQRLITAVGNVPNVIMSGINSAFGWLQGLLTNIWNAILGIPSAVAGAMSGLWEDAGLVWSGIKDTTVAINNWLNNVLTGALDGISSGIDNLTNGLSNTWEGIEAGLANIAGKIGTGVSTGVADLTGVIDKIGSIPMDLIGLIIPSDWSTVTDRVDSLMFNVAENPFKEFMDSLSAVFAKRKSIFDLRITLYGKVYPLVPLVLKPALDTARTFLTGAVMLVSLTLVYVRAKGISWWK